MSIFAKLHGLPTKETHNEEDKEVTTFSESAKDIPNIKRSCGTPQPFEHIFFTPPPPQIVYVSKIAPQWRHKRILDEERINLKPICYTIMSDLKEDDIFIPGNHLGEPPITPFVFILVLNKKACVRLWCQDFFSTSRFRGQGFPIHMHTFFEKNKACPLDAIDYPVTIYERLTKLPEASVEDLIADTELSNM